MSGKLMPVLPSDEPGLGPTRVKFIVDSTDFSGSKPFIRRILLVDHDGVEKMVCTGRTRSHVYLDDVKSWSWRPDPFYTLQAAKQTALSRIDKRTAELELKLKQLVKERRASIASIKKLKKVVEDAQEDDLEWLC